MASLVYNAAKANFLTGTIDLDTDDIRILLVKTTYTEDDAHTFVDDGSANDPASHEIVATNYVRKALASEAVTVDQTNNRAEFDAADVTWTALGGATNDTIKGAVVYENNAADTAAALICFIDFPSDLPTNGSDVTIQFNAEGILQLT